MKIANHIYRYNVKKSCQARLFLPWLDTWCLLESRLKVDYQSKIVVRVIAALPSLCIVYNEPLIFNDIQMTPVVFIFELQRGNHYFELIYVNLFSRFSSHVLR